VMKLGLSLSRKNIEGALVHDVEVKVEEKG
jgi:hypothetical protein